jgi:hypothetical protein
MHPDTKTLHGGESHALPSALARSCSAALLCLFLSSSVARGWLYLKRIAFLPFGLTSYGMVVLMDSDQDGLGEMTYDGRAGEHRTWEIAEYRPVNCFEVIRVDTFVYPVPCSLVRGNFVAYAAADMDRDGLVEVVGEVRLRADTASFPDLKAVCTIEPSAPGNLPDTFNWFYIDSAPMQGGKYRYVTDLDQDSLLEILTINTHRLSTAIYENVADNKESLVYCQPPYAPHIWGDFDQNGKMDFVVDHYEAEHIFECTGDNQFAEVCTVSSAPWTNQHDWFSGRDVDRNGKPEFFVVYYQAIGCHRYLYMFEAVAEHEYTRYLIDQAVSALEGDGAWPVSLCADLDGDGFEELVWARGKVVQIMQPIGPHQFETVWTWSNDHAPDKHSTRCNVADFNRNGYNELYIGGELKTSILEVEAIRLHYPNLGEQLVAGDTCMVHWSVITPPPCDSVSVFFKSDPVAPEGEFFWRLDTIATGLDTSITTWPWVVPDTTLDSAWILVIAYGPGWQYSESRIPISIVSSGVAERIKQTAPNSLPEPTIVGDVLVWSATTPSLRNVGDIALQSKAKLLDASGRVVMELRPGPNDIRHLAPGVYFVHQKGPRGQGLSRQTAPARTQSEGSSVRKVVIQK